MKIKPLIVSIQTAYTAVMAELKRAQLMPKEATSVQCASTEAILQRDPSKDSEWQARPIPKDAQQYDGNGDVYVRERSITPFEVITEETRRRRPKNTLGQSELPGITPAKHWAATEAWLKNGIHLTAKDLEKLKLLGQLAIVSEIVEKAFDEADFKQLMKDAGLADLQLEALGHGKPV